MSRQVALDNIWLKPTWRWGRTEYSLEYHEEFMQRVTGLVPSHPEFRRRFLDAIGMDMIWSTDDGLHGTWSKFGRCTDMGHAIYAADGSDWRQPGHSPFKTMEEVWAFDAVAEYGLPDLEAQVNAYENAWQRQQKSFPSQLVTGGYYKSIVSGAIEAFGWEMLLLAASDTLRMEKVFDSFFRFTLHHMEAWSQTSAEVIIQHDDFVWTSGPFMHPDVYRQVIIPRYRELWKPLHLAGKRVLFCSDGTFIEFMDDLADAGADGFIFEPSNDFASVVERYGSSHVLIGSAVDCRDMTFGSWETVRRGIDHTLALAAKSDGLIIAVGNHIPANVRDDMLEKYLTYLVSRLER